MTEKATDYSNHWNEAYGGGMTMWYPSECIIRFMAKNFKKQTGINEYKEIRKAEKVLDIGCGNGANVLFFKKLDYHAHGCDISNVAVEIGNAMLKHHGYAETLVAGDFEFQDYANDSFDIITSHAALDHVMFGKFKGIVNKIKKILKSGGYIFITLRGMDGFEYEKRTANEVEPRTLITGDDKELNSPFENPHEKSIPQHFFSLEEIRDSLKDFVIINIEKVLESGGDNLEFMDSRYFITAKLVK